MKLKTLRILQLIWFWIPCQVLSLSLKSLWTLIQHFIPKEWFIIIENKYLSITSKETSFGIWLLLYRRFIFHSLYFSFLISRFKIPYIDFVLLLRVKRVVKIVENIEEVTSIREKSSAFIDLCKLIFFLIFINHMCACLWHFVG